MMSVCPWPWREVAVSADEHLVIHPSGLHAYFASGLTDDQREAIGVEMNRLLLVGATGRHLLTSERQWVVTGRPHPPLTEPPPRWGRAPLSKRWHIEEGFGTLRAICGEQMLEGTAVHLEPPDGLACGACFAAVGAR